MSHSSLSRSWYPNRSARITLTVLLALPLTVLAQSVPTAPRPIIEQQRLQERERALREQNERTVDERPPVAPVGTRQPLPDDESPCFRIDRITLIGERSESFQWALDPLLTAAGIEGDGPLNRCLGTAAVDIVRARAQQALIKRGWVTTRVLAAPQDLSTGTLALTLVPGRIAAIRFSADSVLPSPLAGRAMLATAVPASPGDLLNLRDIEQALQNFKRLPTQEADIRIEPSTDPHARPGDSDLVVKVVQKFPLRVALSLDDSGTRATGRNQAGATVSADNLLGLNDLFYVSGSHSIDDHFFAEPLRGTESQTAHYSVPFGYWMLALTASNSRYHLSQAGADANYAYSGKTQSQEIKLSRLIYQDPSRKTTLALKGFRRETSNFIENTEVENQHRTVGGWEASLNHREFIGDATLDGTLAYRQGTGAFGASPALEDAFGGGTSRLRLTTAEVSLNAPFSLNLGDESGSGLATQKLRYSGVVRAQWSATPLTPLDRFAIGGRYSVRGFDGETSLLGDRGWLIRNDIGWAVGQSGAELYSGVDYGQVGGQSTVGLTGRHLAGGVIGVRGIWNKVGCDFFTGAPISKPVGYQTAKVTFGFNLNVAF